MESEKLCQSCSTPLTKLEDFGTEADGSKSMDYCCSCYNDGILYGGDNRRKD